MAAHVIFLGIIYFINGYTVLGFLFPVNYDQIVIKL